MIDSGLLHIGSLLLGIIAWILPVMNLLCNNWQEKNKWTAICMMSLSACAISLSFQIFHMYHLVKIEDWSALMDTMGFLTFIAAVLLIVTIILNGINLIVFRNKLAK